MSTLSPAFIAAFLSAAEVRGREADRFLQAAGIGEPHGAVTEDQFATLYRLIAEANDDELPNLLSHPLRGGAMKFGVLSIIHAPTLGVALYRYTRLLRLMIHDFEVKLVRGADLSTILIDEACACKPMAVQLTLKAFHGLASWLVGRHLHLVRIDFACEAPDHADDLRRLFPGPVFFGRPRSQILLDTVQLSLRVQRKLPDVKLFLARLPRDWMFSPFSEQQVTHQVREILLQNGLEDSNADRVARALRMSPRTLSRRLEAENTGFTAVKDGLRRDLAIERLLNSDVSIEHIAHELDFNHVSSFHRAFRTWTGMTPHTFRNRL